MDATRTTQRPPDERIEPRILWPLLALFWVGSVAATMAQVYSSRRLDGAQPSFGDLLGWVLPGYLVWLAAMPLILALTRRFPFEGRTWLRSAPVHLVASLAIALAVITVDALMARWRGSQRPLGTIMLSLAQGWLTWLLFTYWFLLAFLLAIRHYTAAAARRLRETRLEAVLASTQLAALRTQLHPHFLFNTLNSISSLIDEEPAVARRMIAQVAELLRASLADGDGEWTLERELQLLERYTEIERMRFGDRLHVEVTCERDALPARVPSLLLQPIVENAILHGIQPSLRGGTVRIHAQRADGWLALEVSDDGVGLRGTYDERTGLTNTRERLLRCYPGRQSFQIGPAEPGGTLVRIRIPWSTFPALAEHVAAS